MQLAQMSIVFPLKIPENSSKYLLPSSFSTGKEEFSSDYSLLIIIYFLLFGIKEKNNRLILYIFWKTGFWKAHLLLFGERRLLVCFLEVFICILRAVALINYCTANSCFAWFYHSCSEVRVLLLDRIETRYIRVLATSNMILSYSNFNKYSYFDNQQWTSFDRFGIHNSELQF